MSTASKLWLFFLGFIVILLVTVIPIWFWLASLLREMSDIAPGRLDLQSTLQSILITLVIIPAGGSLIAIVFSAVIGQGIVRTEETLRITLSSIGDGVITTDLKGNVTYQNSISESLTGWSDIESRDRSLHEIFQIVNESSRIKVDNPVDKVLRDGRIVGLANHTVLIRRDGVEFSIDDSAAPIRDQKGNMIGVVLIYRDISKQRETERLVEDALAYAESIVETVREPLMVLDSNLKVLSANRSFYKTFKVHRKAVENVLLYQLGNDQWDIPQLRSLLENVTQEGRVIEGFEVEHNFPSVGLRTMKLNARKLRQDSHRSELILLAMEDVTLRKRADEEREVLLREIGAERSKLLDIFHHAPSFMAILSGEHHVFEIANKRYQELVGNRQLIGLPVRDALPEVVQQGFIDLLDNVYKTGEPFVGSDVLIALQREPGDDKTKLYMDFVYQAIRDADGLITGVMVQGIDLTERKKAETAEIQYKVLFENIPGMFLILDPDYTIKAVSDAYLNATMTERSRIVERNIFDVFPDDPAESDASGVRNLRLSLDRVRTTHKTDVMAVQRYPTRTPEGDFEEKFWSPVNSPVTGKDGSLFFIVHRVEDVTEYIQMVQKDDLLEPNSRDQMMAAEIVQRGHELQKITQQLQDEERRFRTLVEQVKDYAIFMTDQNGLATTWNKGVYRVLGFTEEEFIGVDIVSSIFRPEDVAQGVAQAELNEAAKTGSASDDRWMMRKDGTHFWAVGVTTGLHSDKGELIGFMKVMRDQTQHKNLEESLRASATDLAESDRRKTEFLATLGHELRNPLAPICTGLEAMKLLENDPAAVREIRFTMQRQLQQLIRLIDDLLDISRISHGKMELRKCRVSLQEIIRSAIEAAKPFIDAASHSLTVSAPAESIVLDADPNRIAQVMSNLLNNATKYTPEGGNIRLAVEEDAGYVNVSVQDNGLGIPEELKDTIFEVFTQIDQPLEQGYSGLGIGLTLVKRLVELHGGSIDVSSEGAHKGSTFTVRLPVLSEALPVGAEVDDLDVSVNTGPLRILVVDDNKEAAKMLQEVLNILGNEVRAAFDGQQAIEIASEYLPDVVLMDIGMPKMNGYQAAAHIRAQSYGKEMVLIALTGWGQDDDKRRTQEAGFDFHLVKPTNLAELQHLLKKCKPKVTASET